VKIRVQKGTERKQISGVAQLQLKRVTVRYPYKLVLHRYVRVNCCNFLHTILTYVNYAKHETRSRWYPDSASVCKTCFLYFSGDTFVSLSYLFRLGATTIGEIVLQVCIAMVSTLQEEYLKV